MSVRVEAPDAARGPEPSDFSLHVRVYYEDTDSGGVVYYANYLKFMERARTEYLRSLGFQHTGSGRTDSGYTDSGSTDSGRTDSGQAGLQNKQTKAMDAGASGSHAAGESVGSIVVPDVQFVVRRAQMNFVSPARLDDLLTVSVAVSRLGRAGLDMEQSVSVADTIVCTASIGLACVSSQSLKPAAIPQDIRALLGTSVQNRTTG